MIGNIPALPVAALLAVAATQAAALECSFDTECFDRDACADTAYDVSFGAVDTGTWVMSGIAGERGFVALTEQDGHRAFASANSNGESALLTLAADGSAVFTIHALFDPFYRIGYYGRCEEVE